MFLGVQEIVTNALFGVAVLVGVFYPARKAIIALINLVATIHLLMLIGATGAVLLGMWYEAAILIFVYSLGDVLESYAVDKARGAIRSLMELVPKKALVRKDGNEVVMSTEEIVVGDIVIVRPGERIPVDGTVSLGVSHVDQAAVTGEPIPVGKKIGDEVFAGTINQNGSLEVTVNRLASETMLSKIICSVEEAQANGHHTRGSPTASPSTIPRQCSFWVCSCATCRPCSSVLTGTHSSFGGWSCSWSHVLAALPSPSRSRSLEQWQMRPEMVLSSRAGHILRPSTS